MVPEHHELKTAPPDGYVDLRRMSFGEMLASQGLAYQVSMKASQSGDDADLDLNVTQAKVMEYQFGICVVGHNLEHETGRPLDFKRTPQDVHVLDPRVGGEIANIIDRMHKWETNFPNSGLPSVSASSVNGAAAMAAVEPPTISPSSSSE
jgi:hypothetical protein